MSIKINKDFEIGDTGTSLSQIEKFKTKLNNVDLNTLTEDGNYYCGQNSTNVPVSGYSLYLEVLSLNENYKLQRATLNIAGMPIIYQRQHTPAGWINWQPVTNKSYFTWTPTLSCHTPSEAPTVTYTTRSGFGVKIKITDTISIVFVSAALRGNITAISSGHNYACIAGLPYSSNFSVLYSFNFHDFYQGVENTHPIPTGYFADKTIRVQNGTRGSSVDR